MSYREKRLIGLDVPVSTLAPSERMHNRSIRLGLHDLVDALMDEIENKEGHWRPDWANAEMRVRNDVESAALRFSMLVQVEDVRDPFTVLSTVLSDAHNDRRRRE